MAAAGKILENVINHNGIKVNVGTQLAGKTIGLYFSAHWCEQSKLFTPILANFYRHYHQSKKFEIVFISADEDEESFNKYWRDMPWLALTYQPPNPEVYVNY